MYNILIVEDQKEISDILIKYIERENWHWECAENGFQALEIFSKNHFHLLVLDIMMPGLDGFEVLKNIRSYDTLPVILLTAKESEADRIFGFDLGADDYVIKPFSPRELIKRIQAILRRVYGTETLYLEYQNLKLDENTMILYKDKVEIPITSSEFKILNVFLKNIGIVLTRDQIIVAAYGYDYDGIDRNIDSSIKRIRQKIEVDSKNPKLLRTKYGAGYIFGGADVD